MKFSQKLQFLYTGKLLPLFLVLSPYFAKTASAGYAEDDGNVNLGYVGDWIGFLDGADGARWGDGASAPYVRDAGVNWINFNGRGNLIFNNTSTTYYEAKINNGINIKGTKNTISNTSTAASPTLILNLANKHINFDLSGMDTATSDKILTFSSGADLTGVNIGIANNSFHDLSKSMRLIQNQSTSELLTAATGINLTTPANAITKYYNAYFTSKLISGTETDKSNYIDWYNWKMETIATEDGGNWSKEIDVSSGDTATYGAAAADRNVELAIYGALSNDLSITKKDGAVSAYVNVIDATEDGRAINISGTDASDVVFNWLNIGNGNTLTIGGTGKYSVNQGLNIIGTRNILNFINDKQTIDLNGKKFVFDMSDISDAEFSTTKALKIEGDDLLLVDGSTLDIKNNHFTDFSNKFTIIENKSDAIDGVPINGAGFSATGHMSNDSDSNITYISKLIKSGNLLQLFNYRMDIAGNYAKSTDDESIDEIVYSSGSNGQENLEINIGGHAATIIDLTDKGDGLAFGTGGHRTEAGKWEFWDKSKASLWSYASPDDYQGRVSGNITLNPSGDTTNGRLDIAINTVDATQNDLAITIGAGKQAEDSIFFRNFNIGMNKTLDINAADTDYGWERINTFGKNATINMNGKHLNAADKNLNFSFNGLTREEVLDHSKPLLTIKDGDLDLGGKLKSDGKYDETSLGAALSFPSANITLKLNDEILLIKMENGVIKGVPKISNNLSINGPGVMLKYIFLSALCKGDDCLNNTSKSGNKDDETNYWLNIDGKNDIYDQADSLKVYLSQALLKPSTKLFSESRAAAFAFAAQGSDLIESNGMQNAASAAKFTDGFTPFGAAQYGNSTYATGSSINVFGFQAMAGLSRGWAFNNGGMPFLSGYFSIGGFGEFGLSDYTTHNEFSATQMQLETSNPYAEAKDFEASGSASYVGMGGLARYETLKKYYVDASLRLGLSNNHFNSGLTDLMGTEATLDYSQLYTGLSFGLGKTWILGIHNDLDTYARYFLTSAGKTTVGLNTGEDEIEFDAISSSMTRIGARYSHDLTSNLLRAYVGVAYDMENEGTVSASTRGIDDSRLHLAEPTLSGNTTMAEIGLQGDYNARLSADAGAKIYFGERDGYAISAKIKYELGELAPEPEKKENKKDKGNLNKKPVQIAAGKSEQEPASTPYEELLQLEMIVPEQFDENSCSTSELASALKSINTAKTQVLIQVTSGSGNKYCSIQRAWELAYFANKQGVSFDKIAVKDENQTPNRDNYECNKCSVKIKTNASSISVDLTID